MRVWLPLVEVPPVPPTAPADERTADQAQHTPGSGNAEGVGSV
jgi:hypothetical protein